MVAAGSELGTDVGFSDVGGTAWSMLLSPIGVLLSSISELEPFCIVVVVVAGR